MNEGTGTKDGADMDEADMDVQHAAVIMQQARERARRELRASYPVLFATWGVVWLISDGAIWLSVRGQRPYHGPTTAPLVALILLIAAGVAVTLAVVGRAVSGVGGLSALQRRIFLVSLLAGYAGVFTLESALFHAGASWPVIGVYGATAPVLMGGLLLAASSALRLDWTVFGLGIWVIVVAAAGAYAGPVTVWAVEALAGGLALLLMAAIQLARSRS